MKEYMVELEWVMGTVVWVKATSESEAEEKAMDAVERGEYTEARESPGSLHVAYMEEEIRT